MPLTRIIVESSDTWISLAEGLVRCLFIPLTLGLLYYRWALEDLDHALQILVALATEIMHIIPCVLGQIGLIEYAPIEPIKAARIEALKREKNPIMRTYRRVVMKYTTGLKIISDHSREIWNEIGRTASRWSARGSQILRLWYSSKATEDWALHYPKCFLKHVYWFFFPPKPRPRPPASPKMSPVLDLSVRLKPYLLSGGSYRKKTLGMSSISLEREEIIQESSPESQGIDLINENSLEIAAKSTDHEYEPRIRSIEIEKKPESPIKSKLELPISSKSIEIHFSSKPGDYAAVKHSILSILENKGFDDGLMGPVVVRLAWHCCATYDKSDGTGGSNGGTIRLPPEVSDDGNTGLHAAMMVLEIVKSQHFWISYADLYTYAGAVAIEAMGGPIIPWKPGRIDVLDPALVPRNGRLPLGGRHADHIKEVFYRMGFNDQELTALIGAHTLGRTHKKYSGWDGKWTDDPIRFDNAFYKVLLERRWLKGVVPETQREQYYDESHELMMLETDMELTRHPEFLKWVEIYAADEHRYFEDFSKAFAKLLELGVERDPSGIASKKV